MVRLKDRNRQIPNGLTFYQPETGWRPGNYSSFDAIVRGCIGMRGANTFLAQRNGWSLDYDTVANEVDLYNATLCQQNGWWDYIIGDGSPPPSSPHSSWLSGVKNAAVGAKTLVEWIKNGAEAVSKELSNQRALTCVTCPQNKAGDYTRFFTEPVAEAIRAEVSKRKMMELSTDQDDHINVCDACGCPLKLKVHMPVDQIRKKMPQNTKDLLDKRCWILNEP